MSVTMGTEDNSYRGLRKPKVKEFVREAVKNRTRTDPIREMELTERLDRVEKILIELVGVQFKLDKNFNEHMNMIGKRLEEIEKKLR
jgi:hypothetical protein